MINRKILGVGFIIFALLGTLAWFFLSREIRVGDEIITRDEIKYKNQINKVFYPDSNANSGAEQLRKAFLYAEILKKYGLQITEKVLRDEERRIDESTKDPKRLREIKALFGEDQNAYRRVFILPTLTERVVVNLYNQHPKVQESAINRARGLITDFKSNKASSFESVAQMYSYQLVNLEVSEKNGIIESHQIDQNLSDNGDIPPEIKASILKQEAELKKSRSEQWLQIAKKLKPSEVFDEPINDERGILVVKLVSIDKKRDIYKLQAIAIPKQDFTTWLDSEKESVLSKLQNED